MTPAEMVSIALGASAFAVTALVGGFAVWQAREHAKDARDATNRTADIQREIAVATRALETNVQILSGVLGTQIDRLTQHISQANPPWLEVLQLFQSTMQAAPTALPTRHDPDSIETTNTKTLVGLVRYAGALNITASTLSDSLLDRVNTGKGLLVEEMMDVILKDSHRAFHGALRRLQALDKSDIVKADATETLEAFEQNYVPWVFASLEQRRMAAKAKST